MSTSEHLKAFAYWSCLLSLVACLHPSGSAQQLRGLGYKPNSLCLPSKNTPCWRLIATAEVFALELSVLFGTLSPVISTVALLRSMGGHFRWSGRGSLL